MSDEWAGKFAAKIRQKRQDEKDEIADRGRVLGLIHSYAPHLWEHLCRALAEKASTANRIEPYFTGITAVIPGSDQYNIESETAYLWLSCGNGAIQVDFKLTRKATNPRDKPKAEVGSLEFKVEGTQLWFRNKEGGRWSADEAAEYLLDMLA